MACTYRCESMGVTLAYLKGKDAESEEAQNMRTAAAWRCMHHHQLVKTKSFITGRSPADQADASPVLVIDQRFLSAGHPSRSMIEKDLITFGYHNSVHASLKSSRGPRGMSVAGSP
jgi:hypothetical protein